MDFVFSISTPANTAANTPKISIARLTRGRLVGGFLYMPAGPAGTLHFLSRYGVHQLCPFAPGESYALNNATIPFHFSLDLSEPPYAIDLVTWNTSENYAHVCTVGFFLEPLEKRKWKLIDAINSVNPVKGYRKP